MPDLSNKKPVKRDFEILMSVDKNQLMKDYEETKPIIESDEKKMRLFMRIFYITFPFITGASILNNFLKFLPGDLKGTFLVIIFTVVVLIAAIMIYFAEKYNDKIESDRQSLKDIYAKVGMKVSSQRWKWLGFIFSFLSFFFTLGQENIVSLVLVLLGILCIEIQIKIDKKLEKRFYKSIQGMTSG